ncbi:MAG: acetyl-CoA decarbonylase/synthase complex subunit delta [Spirochaetaceae bacterium]|jgi:acetyl-CoA decarbonylase/synthase complex subunit delta|nr:acetyl-CoA decarbonylase/synthase complex subunit delta [Spirochaetaceae bacterium]
MPLKRVSQKFNASIKEVTVGTGDKVLKLGGECTYPLYSFDAPMPNPPKVGIEISDKLLSADYPAILKKFYDGCGSIADAAKKACTVKGASFVSLYLESADPNGDNASIDDCVKTAKAVADAVTLPLVIQGSKNEEKDSQLFTKIAEVLRGKNCLFISAKEANYKQIAVGVVQAGEAKVAAESAVDLNLAKQLNTVVTQVGVKLDNVVMHVGQSAVGYGFEYLASTMDRIEAAALEQNDSFLQVPIITPAGQEAWGVKEAVASEQDFPEWGSQEQRGIDMEVSTAAANLTTGSNAVILRHPKSVEAVANIIAALV